MDKLIIEKATVRFSPGGGQGVLVTGNFIVTAAHCIKFNFDIPAIINDPIPETIITATGEELKVNLLALEAFSDIAVLGMLDEQEHAEEAERFESFCEHTKPLQLLRKDMEVFKNYQAYVYNHLGVWQTCTIIKSFPTSKLLVIKPEKEFPSGTSGSPVVDDSGKLIGIVSNCSMDTSPVGSFPFLRSCLPVYLYKAMGSKRGLNDFKLELPIE